MLAAIQARRKEAVKEEDGDDEIDIQPINVYGCGNNNYGRLAQYFGNTTHSDTFIQCKINNAVHPNVSFLTISCGAGHVLAISTTNQVYSWGKCHFGQLGHGQEDVDRYLPRIIKALVDIPISKIGAQDSSSHAVSMDGKLYSWGCGYFGALGNGNESTQCLPVEIAMDEPVIDIIGGKHHAIVITENSLFGFGQNKNGQLGLGDTLNRKEPTKLTIAPPFISVACGDVFSCIVTDKIILIGNGNTLPEDIDFPEKIKMVSARHQLLAILTECGKVYEFDLSLKKFKHCDIINENIISIVCGERHIVALNDIGDIFTWGDNYCNKLGHSTNAGPKVEDFPKPGKQISAGSNHTFVLV